MVNVIINKEDIKGIINEIIKRNDVEELKKYIQKCDIELNYLNNKYSDILIQSIENDASIDFVECIINHGKYTTLNYIIRGGPDYVRKNPLAFAIQKNNFKLADYLMNYDADINYIPYEIFLNTLNRRNSKYFLEKGILITTDFVNNLIKDNVNYFLKQIFKFFFFDNELILKFLTCYKNRESLSIHQLNDLVEKEKSKIVFSESMYKIALVNKNYDAINILYNNETREKQIVIKDFYNIIKTGSKEAKLDFLNKIKSQEINISIEESYLKEIESIVTEEEKKEIVMNYIINNDLDKLCKYIMDNNIKLKDIINKYDYDNDLLKLSIDNDVSFKMLDFIIEHCHYKYFDYYIHEKDNKTSLLCYVLSQNKYKVFDFLIKKGADINYGNTLIYLYNNKLLNKKNLKYILCQNYNLASSTIKSLIIDNRVNLMKTIFQQYTFNNFFILKFLSMYNDKTPLSEYDLKYMIKEEKDKLNFNSSLYKTAIEKDNYDALQCLYDYDNRNKDIALYEIFKILDNDEKKRHSGRITIFTEKIKNGQLRLKMDEKFLGNFDNIEDKKKLIIEKIKNNDIVDLRNYVVKNHILLTVFNNDNFDILIYAIEYDVSIEIIKFIIHYYFSLNYYIYDTMKCKYKSPLSCAIGSNKFNLANILLANGANINYKIFDSDLIYKFRNENLLNNRNLKYSLDKGYKITSKLITMLIRNNKNDYLKNIINYFIFDKNFILKLLSISKNKIPLSSKSLNNIIIKEKSKITIKHEWYFEALYYYNNDAVNIFINNDSNEQNIFFDKYELYKLLDKAIYDYNYDFIKKLFSSNWFDYKNFNIEEYLSSKRIRYRLDIIDHFIEKKLDEPSFSFKKISFENILLNICEISNITFNFIKRYIQKSLNHTSFDFNYINFEKVLQVMVNVKEITEMDRQSYYKLFEILIEHSLSHKTFDFKNSSFERVLSIVSKCRFSEKDFSYYFEFVKFLILKSFSHETFSFKYIDFEKILIVFKSIDISNERIIDGCFQLEKLIIEESFNHKTFDFNRIHFENVISIISQYKYCINENSFSYISYLLKLVIEKSMSHPMFNCNIINIPKVLLILRQVDNDVSILEYFVEELFNCKSFNINNIGIEDVLLASFKIENETFMKYIMNKIMNHSSFRSKDIYFIRKIIVTLEKMNNIQLFEYFLNQLIHSENFELNDINIKNLLLISTKLNNNSAITCLMDIIFKSLELDNRILDIDRMNINKILLSAISSNNLFVIKYLFENVNGLNNNDSLDIQRILQLASKINNSDAMKIIIEKSCNITSIDVIKDYEKLDFHRFNDYDIQSLSLLLNLFIKLHNLKVIKYLVEDSEFKHKIDINEKDINKESPIIEASYVAKNCYEGRRIFEYLLENGANCNVKDYNDTPFFLLLLKNENYYSLHSLFQHEVSITVDIDVNNSLLMKAIYQNDIDSVNDIIHCKCNCNEVKSDYLTNNNGLSKFFFPPLILSYLLNHNEIFKILMKYCNINESDYYGYTLLHYAILKNDIELMNHLINKSIKDDSNNKNNYIKSHSVFDIAIKIKNKEAISILLDNDHENQLIHIKNRQQESPIITLINMDCYSVEEKLDLIEKLISKGVDINTIDLYGKTAVIYAIEKRLLPVVKLLLDNGALIFKNDEHSNYYVSLMNIIDICQPNVFEYMLNNCNLKNYMIDIIEEIIKKDRQDLLKIIIPKYTGNYLTNENNNSILKMAIDSKKISILKYLIENGIDIGNVDNTTLKKIITLDWFDIVKLLIPKYIDINIQDDYGNSPLIYALYCKNERIIKYLINSGADINLLNHRIEIIKPIISDNNIDLLKFLIDHQLDVNRKDRNDETLLNYAIKSDHHEIINYLIKSNANLSCVKDKVDIISLLLHNNDINLLSYIVENQGIQEILEEIVDKKKIDLFELLIKNSLNINKVYENGNTILVYAIEKRNIPIIKCLIDHGVNVEIVHSKMIEDIIHKGKFDILKYLIIKRIEMNEKIEGDNEPLIYIINMEYEPEIKCLSNLGITLSTTNNKFEVKDAIVKKSNLNIIKELVPNYLDVDLRDESGNTILIHALNVDNNELIAYLLNCHPNIDQIKINVDIDLFKNIVKSNNLELLKIIFNNNFDVNQKDKYDDPMLNFAIKYGNDQTVQYLIDKGADVNKEGRWNHTPLIIAIRNRKFNIVKLLIEKGADVSYVNDMSESLSDLNKKYNDKEEYREVFYQINELLDLHINKENKNIKLIKAINNQDLSLIMESIDEGADIDIINKRISIINSIVTQNKLDLLKYLVEHGLDVNRRDKKGNTILIYAIKTLRESITNYLLDCHIDIDRMTNLSLDFDIIKKIFQLNNKVLFKLLYHNTFDVNQKDGHGDSLFTNAIDCGNEELIKYLIDCNADVNKEGRKYSTPIVSAIFKGNVSIVKYLIAHGANVNKNVSYGNTPLIYAIENNNAEIVRCLVENGADLNKEGENFDTPLIWAINNENEEIVKYLVEHGADINKKGKYNYTPLINAIQKNNNSITKYLIDCGADLTGKNIVVLKNAIKSNNTEIVKYLVKHGIDINKNIIYQETPLILAIQKNSEEIVKFLIENGADVNKEEGYWGEKPIVMAVQNKNIMKYLIQSGANLDCVDRTNKSLYTINKNINYDYNENRNIYYQIKELLDSCCS